ncbi:MAG: hypothetical protein AAF741_14770 [Bacteroidota bacterium]
MFRRLFSVLSLVLLYAFAASIAAQTTLNCNDFTSFQALVTDDFVIGSDVSEVKFRLRGGDGGNARLDALGCDTRVRGGTGALIELTFPVSSNPAITNALRPGGEIRIFVGQNGDNADRGCTPSPIGVYGAGGGSTAILYRDNAVPAGTWILLANAGGGGGGARPVAGVFRTGREGLTGINGGNSGNANGGVNGACPQKTNNAGPGGSILCANTEDEEGKSMTTAIIGQIASGDLEVILRPSSFATSTGGTRNFRATGGDGYTGGGAGNTAGGGGGGFSGGAAANTFSGGGGGSYVTSLRGVRAVSLTAGVNGGTPNLPRDGFVSIDTRALPAQAVCPASVTAAVDANGEATIDPEVLFELSSTVPCDATTTLFYIDNEFPIPFDLEQANFTFNCTNSGQIGNLRYIIQDTDGTILDECTSPFTLVDNIPPVMNCLGTSVNLGPQGMATITPADIDNGSTDNCSITSFSLSETTFDANDVGVNVVTLQAFDGAGNSNSCTVNVNVQLCPDIGNLSGPDVYCPGFNADFSVTGLANMAATVNQDRDYGIRLVAFPGNAIPADPYTGGIPIDALSFGQLTNGGTTADFTAGNSLAVGNYVVCAILTPVPPASVCRPVRAINLTVGDVEAPVPNGFIASELEEVQKVAANDGEQSDVFGVDVDIYDDVAISGAFGDGDNGIGSGSAYIFRNDGTNWTQEQKLTASDGAMLDRFGSSVAIWGDVAIVGALQDGDNGNSSGSVYVFRYDGTNWVEEQKLLADDGDIGDFFGVSLDVENDIIIVGASGDDSQRGSAYIFRYNGTDWVQTQKLIPAFGSGGDQFGSGVVVADEVAIVGAIGDGSFRGATYVYRFNGSSYVQAQKLIPFDGVADDRFGNDISLANDVLVLGAQDDDTATGGAYVYRRSGNSWGFEQKLVANDASVGDRFGSGVSVGGDLIVVGAANSLNGRGSIYAFNFDGSAWSQSEKITASDGQEDDAFGLSVSLFDNSLMVGAPGDDISVGSAYFFEAIYRLLAVNASCNQIPSPLAGMDNCTSDGNIQVVIDPPGPLTINGSNEVTYKLTDALGNTSTARQEFLVTGCPICPSIGGLTGPAISCPGDDATFMATGLIAMAQAENNDQDYGIRFVAFPSDMLPADPYVGGTDLGTVPFSALTNGNSEASLTAGSTLAAGNFTIFAVLAPTPSSAGCRPVQSTEIIIGDVEAPVPDGFFAIEWEETQKVVADDGAQGDLFGAAVAVSGDVAIATAFADGDNGTTSGSAYIFRNDGSSWNQEQKLIASDGEPFEQFGFSAAISRDVALVGAFQDDDNGNGSGSAYVFRYDGNDWVEEQKLLPTDGAMNDAFGVRVALLGDLALVGAFGDDNGTGSAYVFRFDGSSWVEEQKLTALDQATSDRFGWSVALAENTAIVGAFGDESERGAAYFFRFDGSSWNQEQKLTANDGVTGDRLGFSVAIADDVIVVGAEEDDTATGSAYVYRFNGANWVQEQKLTAINGSIGNRFGTSVAIQGDQIISGAISRANGRGSVYVFSRLGTNWFQTQEIIASDGASSDNFGGSISLSGETLLAGALGDDSGMGGAYFFESFFRMPNVDQFFCKQTPTLLTGTDNCSDASTIVVTADPPGPITENGDIEITFTLTDEAGNSSIARQGFFVNDCIVCPTLGAINNPSISCPGDDATFTVTGLTNMAEADNNILDFGLRFVAFSGTVPPADPYVGSDFDLGSVPFVSLTNGNTEAAISTGSILPPGSYTIYTLLNPAPADMSCRPVASTQLIIGDIEAPVPTSFVGIEWEEVQEIVAGDQAAFDVFGTSVSIFGDVAIVGASGNDDNGSGSGSAYVFRFDGTSWTQEAKLVASDGADSDEFGSSVSIFGDLAVVGAFGDGDNGFSSGSAYVFGFDGTNWSQLQKLTASDGTNGDQFGASVDIYGNTIVIGSARNDNQTGAAYVFGYDGVSWTEVQKLTATDATVSDEFGQSVSIEENLIVVGASGDGALRGSAYIFRFDGSNWVQEQKIVASDGANLHQFGFSVDQSGDVVLVGAVSKNNFTGGAYVYRFDGTTWNEEQILEASDGEDDDQYGWRVALRGDVALVGAVADDSGRGSAYVYRFDGTNWGAETKLTASNRMFDDQFGRSVALGDNTILIGARGVDLFTGSAYFLDGTYVLPTVDPFSCNSVPPVPTATDNCSAPDDLIITADPAGPITVEGTTDVTYTFTDEAGNSSTATQEFVVNTCFNCPVIADISGPASICKNKTNEFQVSGLIGFSQAENLDQDFGLQLVAHPGEVPPSDPYMDGIVLDEASFSEIINGMVILDFTGGDLLPAGVYTISAILNPVPDNSDCRPVASATLQILKVDCGNFFWNGN